MPLNIARQSLLCKRVLFCKRTTRAARRLGLASLILVCGTNGLQTAIANGDTRTLTIHHTHSNEDIVVTFKRNGRYDEAGLARLNHFLRDWRNQRETKMDPRLFDVVWEVYQDVGGKAPIQIISAYRSPETNSMLRRRSRGVAKFSQHMLGKAMDFNIPGVSLEKIRVAGLRLQRGGVGYYPTSGSPFVHLDVGNVRHWPRMTHDQLVRVFPNGRTVHVPSDGRPLPGYSLALADIQRRGSSPNAMSLAAAHHAGIATDGKPVRNFFAKLFSKGNQDDDEETSATPETAPRVKAVAEAETAKPVRVAEAIPLPRTRPAAKPSNAFVVASAASVPVSMPESARAATAADVVRSRGLWTAAAQANAEAPPAPARAGSREQRMVWTVGPQGQPVGSPTPVPRRRPNTVTVASADMTASMPPWPVGPGRNDNLPSSLLSYGSIENAPGFVTAARPTTAVAPMGHLRQRAAAPPRNTTILARTPAAPKRAAAPAPVASHATVVAARLGDNPWLRGMILSPSVQDDMDVKSFGSGDPRLLTAYMLKPTKALAMRFSEEVELEADADRFSGQAVTFLPTVTFGTLTAQLR
ncbi:MAG: DUF882 domain-containing protein [Variibacter sp.]